MCSCAIVVTTAAVVVLVVVLVVIIILIIVMNTKNTITTGITSIFTLLLTKRTLHSISVLHML